MCFVLLHWLEALGLELHVSPDLPPLILRCIFKKVKREAKGEQKKRLR